MHELPVTENILEIALRHANSAGANKISNIYLVIGQYASIIDDSIQFYWDLISKNTIAEGANLQFKRIPAQFECLDCKTTFQPSDGYSECPECGSLKIKIIKGIEFFIEAIDIET